MSQNRSAVLEKIARRGGAGAVARARRIASRNPEGRVARLLGLTDGVRGATIDRKEPIDRDGRKRREPDWAQRRSDAVPMRNVGRELERRRIPGSPF